MGSETVHVKALSPTTTQVKARDHKFVVDKPKNKGGKDKAPMSSEYVLGALGSCQITTAYRVAAKRGLTIEDLEVIVSADFEGGKMVRVHVDFAPTGPGQEKDWENLMRLTDRVCTISQALGVPMEHTLTWTPAKAA